MLCTLLLIASMQAAPAWAQTYDCTAQSELAVGECEALVALYDSTNGDGWTDNDGWLSTTTPCSWYGVTCSEVGDGVMMIDLYNNNLVGTIPAALGNLAALESLVLSYNQLTGGIPASLGNLTGLVGLDLMVNQLTGGVPVELANLPYLQALVLSSNQLTGEIPAALGNLTELVSLALAGNQLTGGIPTTLGNLSNLITLALANNQLTGSIPGELGNLTALNTLALFGNQLTGSIPTTLANLTALDQLYLHTNQLAGPLPVGVANLGAEMSHCNLTNNPGLYIPNTVDYTAIGVDPICGLALQDPPAALILNVTPDRDPLTFGSGGGVFAFTTTVLNTSDQEQHFDLWFKIYNSSEVMRVRRGPRPYSAAAGATLVKTFRQAVPARVTAGTYQGTIYAGTYPDQVLASAGFMLVKDAAPMLSVQPRVDGLIEAWGDEASAVWEEAEMMETAAEVPGEFFLAEAYPNPFNPATRIEYGVPVSSTVRLVVYDGLGREVARLVDGVMPAGVHAVEFSSTSLPSGIYLYRLETETGAHVRVMTLVK